MKDRIITFKVEPEIEKILSSIPNKSEFIRSSILQAMDCICPVCNGSGIFNPRQKKHWDDFLRHHTLTRCAECDEMYITCGRKRNKGTHDEK